MSTRAGIGVRRTGYVVAVLVNVAMLWGINRWPGWDVLPFLTDDTSSVLGLVNASIVVNVAANLLYLVRDPVWVKALGDVVTTGVGLAALLRIWQVFPFDFGTTSALDWELVTRILLGVAIVGSGIAIVAALVTLVRAATGSHEPPLNSRLPG